MGIRERALVIFLAAVLGEVLSATQAQDPAQDVTHPEGQQVPLPVIITTWDFPEATEEAWAILTNETATGTAVDAVEAGCNYCELRQCHGSVGFGGKPDENGETTLDAMIMDGATHDVGAVGCLRRVKSAIRVARMVMERTKHTLLVGELATEFAVSMGFKEENLTTEASAEMHKNWTEASCQPNHWENVVPDPTTSCGPYEPASASESGGLRREGVNRVSIDHDGIGMVAINEGGKRVSFDHDAIGMLAMDEEGSRTIRMVAMAEGGKRVSLDHDAIGMLAMDEEGSRVSIDHDTIGMVAMDGQGRISAGTSTNGLSNKIPGRVGDSPIPGSGAYVDREVGGAAGTGNGDIMMRFAATHRTVEAMRSGLTPSEAAKLSLDKIALYYPDFRGAIVAIRTDGEFGAACYGYESFPFVVARGDLETPQRMNVTCERSVA